VQEVCKFLNKELIHCETRLHKNN